MTTEISHIPLDQIAIGTDRARDIDAAWVEALAAMIQAQGPIHPIRVRLVYEGYRLVSGLHRLEAFRLLGAEDVPCTVSSAATDDEARLEEVMENLGRQELKALDRCHHLYELKKVWEASRARPLVDVLTEEGGKSFPTPDENAEVFGFARDVAEEIGLSKRAINMAVKIWCDLASSSCRRLVGTKLATKQTELKALSEQTPSRQAKILDLILDPAHPGIQNVAEALFHLDNGAPPDAIERRYMVAAKSLSGLDDTLFDRVIAAQEERVIASLKRRGRI